MSDATSFLRNASAVQPLLIVLEDLHWSDRGTLDLLVYLARVPGVLPAVSSVGRAPSTLRQFAKWLPRLGSRRSSSSSILKAPYGWRH